MTPLETALKAAEDTEAILVGEDVLGQTGSAFRELWRAADTVILVADPRTWAAAGDYAKASLTRAGLKVEVFLFAEEKVHASYENVERLRTFLRDTAGVPVAVGSGTLNDLTKLASEECGRRYGVVATAASMDGYTSYGASISVRGIKQTLYCRAPRLLVADTRVLAGAPEGMTAAGYADLLAKTTAGADWILADALEVESIHDEAWSLVQPSLAHWTGDPEGVLRGDPEALEQLLQGLVMAGLAMQVARSSRPASGAEHQFSHLWDMQGRTVDGKSASHGFKVAVGTLAARHLYGCLLARQGEVDIERACRSWSNLEERIKRVQELHQDHPFLVDAAVEAIRAKHIDRTTLRHRLEHLAERWPDIRERLEKQLPAMETLKNRLKRVGAPTSPGEIGVEDAGMPLSFLQAATIRNRYTVLDTLTELGHLGNAAESFITPCR